MNYEKLISTFFAENDTKKTTQKFTYSIGLKEY